MQITYRGIVPVNKNYYSKESLIQRLILRKKETLFKWLTSNSLPLFLRGRDVISVAPQIYGYYEIRIKDLIEHYAKNGYGDFLIDIGANIGLSTCQSGDYFKEVHCYEPNPNCFNILMVNTKISLNKCKVYLNKFGLGSEDATNTLYVPRGNWGGGFIHDENNSYDDDELGSKDGYTKLDLEKYDAMPILIQSAPNKLKELFLSLIEKNLLNGFIKIDVEGYEPLILKSIAQVIPDNLKVIILFECFTKNLSPENLLANFNGRAEAYKLVRNPPKNTSKIKRFFKIIAQFGYRFELEKFSVESTSTDIVFIVNSASA